MVQDVPAGADQLEMSCTDDQLAFVIQKRGYDRPYTIVKRDYSSGICTWWVWFEGDDHATEINAY